MDNFRGKVFSCGGGADAGAGAGADAVAAAGAGDGAVVAAGAAGSVFRNEQSASVALPLPRETFQTLTLGLIKASAPSDTITCTSYMFTIKHTVIPTSLTKHRTGRRQI